MGTQLDSEVAYHGGISVERVNNIKYFQTNPFLTVAPRTHETNGIILKMATKLG